MIVDLHMKKNKYPKYFTVGDLRKLLAQEGISNDLPIGVAGHFGEFLKMDACNFRVSRARRIPVDGRSGFEKGWRHADPDYSPIFLIETPNLGEEPD